MATPLSGMEATHATPEPASANSTESTRCKYKSYSVTTKLDAVKYGLENSKAAAAKKFNVDPKRIREWTDNKRKLEEMLSQSRYTQSKRKRLCGGGRKALNETMEYMLVDWIAEMRGLRLRVTRKMVQLKAVELFNNDETIALETEGDRFEASKGWLENFFSRHHITLRRRTTLGQKVPDLVIPKLENFILYVRYLRIQKDYMPDDIIAMDETAVWLDMPGENTVDMVGVKSVPLRTTGHEKNRITVYLAAKASGRKL